MDSNQLIVGLVQALAWPVFTFFIILLLRKPFIELLKNVDKMKWQGIEFEFGKHLVNAEKEAKVLNLPPAEKVKLPAFKQEISLYERMKALAKISPAAAVGDSWKAVQFAAKEVAEIKGVTTWGNRTILIIIEKLIEDGLLDMGALGLYEDLRVLRNSATHRSDFSITVDEALRYIELSLSLANRLQEIADIGKSTKSK